MAEQFQELPAALDFKKVPGKYQRPDDGIDFQPALKTDEIDFKPTAPVQHQQLSPPPIPNFIPAGLRPEAPPRASGSPMNDPQALADLTIGVPPSVLLDRLKGGAASLVNTLLPGGDTRKTSRTLPVLNPEQEIGSKLTTIGSLVPFGEAAGSRLLSLLPSEERAGLKFQQVMGAAKDVPINTGPAEEIAARAKELAQRGASAPPKPLRDFIKNQNPITAKFGGMKVQMAPDPMTYEVGRDFASNAGRVSADESLKMAPQMKAQLAKFSEAMSTSNRDAAASVGMGDVYDQAMREYRQAKTLQEALEVAKKWGIKAAIGAGGAAVGIKGARSILGH